MDPTQSFAVVLTDAGPNKIAVIKEVERITGLGLTEAKTLVDRTRSIISIGLPRDEADRITVVLERVGARAEVVEAAGLAAASVGAYTLTLTSVGSKKADVIRALREVAALGMMEARQLADRAPSAVLTNVTREKAEEAARQLEAVGAVVELSQG